MRDDWVRPFDPCRMALNFVLVDLEKGFTFKCPYCHAEISDKDLETVIARGGVHISRHLRKGEVKWFY